MSDIGRTLKIEVKHPAIPASKAIAIYDVLEDGRIVFHHAEGPSGTALVCQHVKSGDGIEVKKVPPFETKMFLGSMIKIVPLSMLVPEYLAFPTSE